MPFCNNNKIETMIRKLESKPFNFSFGIISGRLWGSLAVEDHLRSILGITCGLGIIYGRGSLAVLYSAPPSVFSFTQALTAAKEMILKRGTGSGERGAEV